MTRIFPVADDAPPSAVIDWRWRDLYNLVLYGMNGEERAAKYKTAVLLHAKKFATEKAAHRI